MGNWYSKTINALFGKSSNQQICQRVSQRVKVQEIKGETAITDEGLKRELIKLHKEGTHNKLQFKEESQSDNENIQQGIEKQSEKQFPTFQHNQNISLSISSSHLQKHHLQSQPLTPLLSSRPSQSVREESLNIYGELISNQIPGTLSKEVQKAERNRTLILWMKENPAQQSQKERNSVLQRQGYEVLTSANFEDLCEQYKAKMFQREQIFLFVFVLLSFSERGNNDLAIRQIQSFFINKKIAEKLVIVKPSNASRYNLFLQNIKVSSQVIESPFQMESIKQKLAKMQLQKEPVNLNKTLLRYWPQRHNFVSILQQGDNLDLFQIKNKIILSVCLRMGWSVITFAKNTSAFKRIMQQYSIFHDLYFQAMLMPEERNQHYLKRFGLQLLENPLQFYLTSSHSILIDRVMRFNGDKMLMMANVLLPITLVYQQIREQFRKEHGKQKFLPEFMCFSEVKMTEKQIEAMKEGDIYENTTFLKANLQKKQNNDHSNVLLVIYVSSKERKIELETGYVFVEARSQETQAQGKHYFRGYKRVIFNLLNSFKVLSVQYDRREQQYRLEVQYGYISRQHWLHDSQNYIPKETEQTYIHRIREDQLGELDFTSLLRFQSNSDIVSKLEDFGDAYCLLQQFAPSLNYYESLFKKNKSEMIENTALLAYLQRKKGFNYEMQSKFRSALEYYYNSLNILTRGKNNQEQRSLHFGQELETIYLDSFRVMFEETQYEKIIRLGQSIIKNDKERGGVQLHSDQFQLQMYRYLACSFFQLTVIQYQVKAEEPRIYHYFQQAFKVIDSMGQFHPLVADFYYHYARTLLLLRKNYDSVNYISKAILIIKTLHTTHDPKLIPYLLLQGIAEYSIHDYQKAKTRIREVKSLVASYFGESSQKLGIVFAFQGKIGWKTKNMATITVFEQEIQIVRHINNKQQLFKSWRRSYSSINKQESDLLSILARIQQIQQDLPFDPLFRSFPQSIPKIYECYLYIASIYLSNFKYEEASLSLLEALREVQLEEGEDCRLTIEIYRLMGQVELEKGRGEVALDLGQKMWRSIVRNQREVKQQSIRYYIYLGTVYQYLEKYNEASQEMKKARELAFKLLPSLSQFQLNLCRITDKLAFLILKIGKILQATKLFKESQEMRKALLKQIHLRRESIKLYNLDFEEYVSSVQVALCLSFENEAELCHQKGEVESQLKWLKKCHEELIKCVGQYHCSTGRIAKKIGQFYLQHHSNVSEAYLYLNSALSIYENSNNSESKLGLIEVNCLLAQRFESENELGVCLQHLGKSVELVRTLPKQSKQYIKILTNFKRILHLILQHKNLNYLKSAYFLVTTLFQGMITSESKEGGNNKSDKAMIEGSISKILELLTPLSKAINSQSPVSNQKIIRRVCSPGRQIDLQRIRSLVSEGKKRRYSQQK